MCTPPASVSASAGSDSLDSGGHRARHRNRDLDGGRCRVGGDWPATIAADLVTKSGSSRCEVACSTFSAPGSRRRVRLDFFGDTVESIRSFEAESQLSFGRLEAVDLVSVDPVPSGPRMPRRWRICWRRRITAAADRGAVTISRRCASAGQFPGWTALLPLLDGGARSLVRSRAGGLARRRRAGQRLAAAAEAHARQLAADHEAAEEQGEWRCRPKRSSGRSMSCFGSSSPPG